MNRLPPLLFLLIGCSSGPVEPDAPALPWDDTREVVALRVEQDEALLVPRGDSVSPRLLATLDGVDEPVDVTAQATWQVADPLVAQVNSDGSIEALEEGLTSAWGLYAGVPSEPVSLEVVRGRWTVEFQDGATGVQGKLLDVELRSSDTTFDDAEVLLEIAGLLPFGVERVEEPWWGVPAGQPTRYRGRFLVPPTAALGAHAVTVTLDGRPPENSLSVQITSNGGLGEVRDCDYFVSEDASNWSFEADGNNARTWLLGDLGAATLTRVFATGGGDVDPWLGLWSLAGELVASSDDDAEYGLDGSAGLQITSLEDVFDGAWYLTAAVSPKATGDAQGGTITTDCAEEQMAEPILTASNAPGLFDAGTTILPGEATPAALFQGPTGTVTRVWAYVDADLLAPDFTTLTLLSPAGTEVELLSPQWCADWLPEDGHWNNAWGGDAPFVPEAEIWVNPSNPGPGLDAFAGEGGSGTWELQWELNQGGSGGLWRDARLFIEVQ